MPHWFDKMILFQEAKLVVSAPSKQYWPDTHIPEIVLAGRSNVGKSSFINAMCMRKKLAYVGKSPGKTRLLNFYSLDDRYMFVDVPGYGYAKISKTQMKNFGQMMEDYFSQREQKKGLVLVVDARHTPTADDQTMLAYARYYQIPLCVVMTKMDKLKSSQRSIQKRRIKEALQLQPEEPLFPFSSEKKEGMEAVWDYLLPIFAS